MKLSVCISLVFPLLLLAQQSGKLDESFDPTTLSDWDASKVNIESMMSLKDRLSHLAIQRDSVSGVGYSDFVYRVQLGSTQDYETAIEIEQRANKNFSEEVIIQFDSPYYKIRVGKMNNREDAQSLQELAIEKGYRRAWVIRTENTPQIEN